jgi:phosphoribosylformimino-5-aminoimidazole carboxamide ribotide isomerase
MFEIIPAIDISEGKCVRLKHGKKSEETVFYDNPMEVAEKWISLGASRLHIVDLDGAFTGNPKIFEIVKKIAKEYSSKINIQIGGGIRNMKAIDDYVEVGVSKVVLGTAAINNPSFLKEACQQFPGYIVLGTDTIDGKLAFNGWKKTSQNSLFDLIHKFLDYGGSELIHTNISKDGALSGVDIELTYKIASETDAKVIASGGVTNYEDIKNINNYFLDGIVGVIVGTALYKGLIKLDEAIKLISN